MSDRLAKHLDAALAILPEGGLVVALSGGMDSSVLLHALAASMHARARDLRALHVDHGLHPDSAHWAEHCRAFAARLDIPIETVRVAIDHDSGTGLEDAARRARMAAFAQNLRPGEVLALAQHRDDQAETVLLKLLRGAGPEGLGGMRVLREFGMGQLWRPLLDLTRAHLHEYAQARGLRWIEDPSNAHTQLRRNFLRQEILPRLAQRWPDTDAALAHAAAWSRAASDFIADEARKALARLQGLDPATLDWQKWLDLPDALRDPVLRLWLRELALDEPAHFHVHELERQLRQAGADRTPCIAFARTQLRRYRDLLYALHPMPSVPEHWQHEWDGTSTLTLPDLSMLTLQPARRVEPPLRVAYRKGGERLKPAGAAHTRELRLLLQEAGVPPWQRAQLPLVWQGDALLAVGDLFLSDTGAAWCDAIDVRIVWMPHQH